MRSSRWAGGETPKRSIDELRHVELEIERARPARGRRPEGPELGPAPAACARRQLDRGVSGRDQELAVAPREGGRVGSGNREVSDGSDQGANSMSCSYPSFSSPLQPRRCLIVPGHGVRRRPRGVHARRTAITGSPRPPMGSSSRAPAARRRACDPRGPHPFTAREADRFGVKVTLTRDRPAARPAAERPARRVGGFDVWRSWDEEGGSRTSFARSPDATRSSSSSSSSARHTRAATSSP